MSIIQPLDQGIIHAFKHRYRQIIVKKQLCALKMGRTVPEYLKPITILLWTPRILLKRFGGWLRHLDIGTIAYYFIKISNNFLIIFEKNILTYTRHITYVCILYTYVGTLKIFKHF